MSTVWRWLLLAAALTQFAVTAFPPGNGDIIGVQCAALDISRGDYSHLYPGRNFERNDEWVEHSARSHRLLGDSGEPQWLMYPPLYPWLLSPLADLGAESWRLTWAALQLLVLLGFIGLLSRWLLHFGVLPDTVLLAALVFGSYPVARVFQLGQTSLLLALVLWASLYTAERGRGVRSALGIGCAVFIKPFLFIIEIAGGLDRHWRRGLTSLAVLLALSVGSILAVGWQSQVDYLEFLRTLSGSQTAFWGNQSLMGAGLRLFTDMPVLWYGFELDPNLRVVSLIVLGSLGVVAAVVQLGSRVRHPIATPALWLAAALLGLSLSWEHHSILLLPAVAYLWTQRPTATGTGLLILATLALGLNLTPLFNDLGVGRVLACIPALGRLTLFLILVLYHLKIDLILKPLPKDA